MVSLSSFAKLGAAARNAMTTRESQTALQNLQTINVAVQKLVKTVVAYQGGLLAANSISSDEAALGVDIKNATADSKKSDVVDEAEADATIAYINSTLEPSIRDSMQALKDKKDKLKDAGLLGTVLGDLQDLRAQTKLLSEALVEKAPASKRAAGTEANAKIDALFADAIKNFS